VVSQLVTPHNIMKSLFFGIIALTISCLAFGQQRVVLLEQFSNSGCPPCAVSTPPVLAHVENNPATTMAIAYHTSFPYRDSMYFENPVDANARVAYYSVSGVPFSIVDGNAFRSTTSSLLNQLSTTFANRQNVAPNYQIEIINPTIENRELSATIRLTSLSNTNTTGVHTAHVVVVEQTVLKSSYLASPGANSENEYKYVMRKMLPTAQGTALQNRGLNGVDEYVVRWPLRAIKSIPEIRLVAFVQSETDKSIGQAQMITPTLLVTSLLQSKKSEQLTVYPNPAKESITIRPTEKITENAPLSIYNHLGQLVLQEAFVVGKPFSIKALPAGVYTVSAGNGSNASRTRLVVVQ